MLGKRPFNKSNRRNGEEKRKRVRTTKDNMDRQMKMSSFLLGMSLIS